MSKELEELFESSTEEMDDQENEAISNTATPEICSSVSNHTDIRGQNYRI